MRRFSTSRHQARRKDMGFALPAHERWQEAIALSSAYPAMTLEEARVRVQEERARICRRRDPATGVQNGRTLDLPDVVTDDRGTMLRRQIGQSSAQRRPVRAEPPHPAWDRALRNPSIGRRELDKLLSDAKSATNRRKDHVEPGHKVRRLTHRPNRVFELTRTVVRWAVERDSDRQPDARDEAANQEGSPARTHVVARGDPNTVVGARQGAHQAGALEATGWRPTDVSRHGADDETFTCDRAAHR